ncbi:MAG: formate/nitrite transporter family protein [Planctomycetota bacterium]|nr:formate/nitrite transporter family protein [Planctomycetota bacterium]MDA0919459.1 formate/nitrite transporter family protein [Planctomycetota bacterium]
MNEGGPDAMPEPAHSSHLVLPDGTPVTTHGGITARQNERTAEDQQTIPVIIKRNDEAVRHPDDTLARAIDEGLEQLIRPLLSLFLSSIAAGLLVGFSAMAVAVVTSLTVNSEPLVIRLLQAAVYPLGFVVCVTSGAQLFTEHTATAVFPVLDRRASKRQLLRLWAVVVAGNILGAFVIASMLTMAEPVIHAHDGYVEIGHHLLSPDSSALLMSAILAGWLMAIGAWLVLSTPPDISQIAVIYIATFLIGLGGLHHSIAGSAEVFLAAYADPSVEPLEVIRFISLALFGNLIGGSFFVGILNYGHIRKTQS